jgi:FlaA1/EpsC-like NDP-sugar epimerase
VYSLKSKVVLVTGAGGSIGSELCARLCALEVSSLIAVDISEYNLFLLEKKLLSLGVTVPIKYVLCDVRHRYLIESLIKEERPSVVYHAAALKHVPMLEYSHNTLEAFRTNILGTNYLLNASLRFKVDKFVFVSTDKAVEPSSMMGASKAFAESLCKALVRSFNCETKVVVARFGNVLGSSGSVTPIWDEQLSKGLPLTVTHEKMLRWFMTIEEAVELLVDSSVFDHVEPYNVFMFDMGDSRSILDMAKEKIASSSRPDTQIEIIGVRPGEKLVEVLKWSHELEHSTPNKKIIRLVSSSDFDCRRFLDALYDIERGCAFRQLDYVKNTIVDCVSYTGDLGVLW